MQLNEKNCKDWINNLSYRDWQPLFSLIPEIEKTTNFGEWRGGETDEEGVTQFPYIDESFVVSKFLAIVYDIPIIISFNWVEWEEGRRMLNDENFDFDTIDIVTKCKLITAIVRSDKFIEGNLVLAFESDKILKILKSIRKEVMAKTGI